MPKLSKLNESFFSLKKIPLRFKLGFYKSSLISGTLRDLIEFLLISLSILFYCVKVLFVKKCGFLGGAKNETSMGHFWQ